MRIKEILSDNTKGDIIRMKTKNMLINERARIECEFNKINNEYIKLEELIIIYFKLSLIVIISLLIVILIMLL